MPEKAVEVKGLTEFRRELRRMSAEFPKEMRRTQKDIADDVAERARGLASGYGRLQAHAAPAIRSYATQVQASVGFTTGGSYPMASVAFWGAMRHTGWYAKARYAHSTRQHPPWVGNSWDVGVRGQGPRAINPAIADMLPEIDERYLKMIDELAKRAFPD